MKEALEFFIVIFAQKKKNKKKEEEEGRRKKNVKELNLICRRIKAAKDWGILIGLVHYKLKSYISHIFTDEQSLARSMWLIYKYIQTMILLKNK